MHFKNPEFLYFLWVLIVPILVHLFQLQKFVKVDFTNVAFLKKIERKTRKSSTLKKWLILATRMLLFSALIFAFSQPYFSNQNSDKNQHYFIYLDNSVSVTANNSQGNIFNNACVDIIQSSLENASYSLLTNSNFYKDLSASELKNYIKNIDITSNSLDVGSVLLQFESEIKSKSISLYEIVLISDFQYYKKINTNLFTNVTSPFSAIQLIPTQKNNLSIDSVYVRKKSTSDFVVETLIRNQGEAQNDQSISLYTNTVLASKRSFSIPKNGTQKISFEFSGKNPILGKIQLTEKDVFSFDNTFYFSLNSSPKIKVLSIGKTSSFLPRIFTSEDYDFSSSNSSAIDYSQLAKQQCIILNELDNIPTNLISQIVAFEKNGGSVIIIPSFNSDINSYNALFSKMNVGSLQEKRTDTLKMTSINYDHPFFKDVFTNSVTNFQYPSSTIHYNSSLKGAALLSFNNKQSFLTQLYSTSKKSYWFSSPLDPKFTNFSNSPLIVPVFSAIGEQSFAYGKLYYRLHQENTIDIAATIPKDNIVAIENADNSIIPLQTSTQNTVSLKLTNELNSPGFYKATFNNTTIQELAFNYSKEESSLDYLDTKVLSGNTKEITTFDSVADFFKDSLEKNEVRWFWKLFLSIAIVSLLLEILILKFFKT